MLIYNTTFHVEMNDARNFVIWLNECYIPEVEQSGELRNPRILRILSHKEQDSECFSLQWEVEDSAALHRWHTKQGARLNEEMLKIFKDKVIGFPTLMEVINTACKGKDYFGNRSRYKYHGLWSAEGDRSKTSSHGLGSDRPEKMYRSVLEIEAYLRTGAGSDFLLFA